MNVSAAIVSRGDVDLSPVLDSLPRDWEKVVWNNGGERADVAVYGRYAAIVDCEHDVIFVQDDDCVLAPESLDALVAAYQPGHVVANMPQRFRDTGFYDDHCLVGFGAVFDRDLPAAAFAQWSRKGGTEWAAGFFYRTCDVLFTALTPRVLLDLPYRDREFASDQTRMWKQPGHLDERTRMLGFARRLRDSDG